MAINNCSCLLLIEAEYQSRVLVGCCRSSERSTMTKPVIKAEKASMTTLAVRTALRIDETPVRRETTTKILSGTRKSDESFNK